MCKLQLRTIYLFLVSLVGITCISLFVSCRNDQVKSEPYNILVIHSFRKDCPWRDDLNNGIKDCFKKYHTPVSIKTFYLDSEYLSDEEEKKALESLLGGIPNIDLILVCDDPATYSLLGLDHQLTYQIPIVFSGVNYYSDSLLKGRTNVTGYITPPDYKKCLNLIHSLYPSANKIMLDIEDNLYGKLALEDFKRQAEENSSSVFEKVEIYNMDKEKGKLVMWSSTFLNTIPRIMPVWDSFYSGRARNTEVPFFAVNNDGFGLGYLGGYMISPYDQTYMATKIAVDILSGKPASAFPITPSKQVPIFDWEQMKKRNISIDQLPSDSQIINMPFEERYRDSIIIVTVVLLLIVMRVAFLLIGLYLKEKKQKRQSQKELNEHRQNLKVIMSSIREGVISVDLEMNIFAINQAALHWLGLEGNGSSYIGRNIFSLIDIFVPGKDHYLKTLLTSVFNEDRQIYLEQTSQMLSIENQYNFPVVGVLSAIYQNHQLYGAVITFHDITEEFTQKEFLALSMGAGDVYYWRYDEANKKIITNSSFFVHYNIFDDGSHSIPIDQFHTMVHPDEIGMLQEVGNILLHNENEKRTVQIRIDFNGKGYQWWECRFNNRVVPSYRNKELFVYGICVNIQKFKETQKALVQARNKAHMSDKLKSAFLANMSHEIRTPLNAIVGFSNVLISEDEFAIEERKLFIETIQNNCGLLLALISDILDLAQIESGTMSFKEEICDVNELINQIATTQQVIIPDRLKLIEKIPEQTIYIITDKLRLNQVITNLINNAVKFTERGTVTFGYTKEPDNYLRFFVEDTGRGIPEQDLQKVFERFFKKDDFTQGAGLGLSICKMIVDRMNGVIDVQSKEGVGSCFTVKIPYIAASKEDTSLMPVKLNEIHKKYNMNTETIESTKGVTILIAEDEDSNYLLLKTILQKYCVLVRAKTGVQALELFKEKHPDLIMLDIKMPEMTGIEALKEIRKLDVETPVIMQSAYVFDSDMDAARQAGASDFITKPINLKIFKTTISKYCPSIEW